MLPDYVPCNVLMHAQALSCMGLQQMLEEAGCDAALTNFPDVCTKMLLASTESAVWGHLAQEKAHTLNMRWNRAAQGSSSPAVIVSMSPDVNPKLPKQT